ncbi:uncharacterized protein LOC142493916 isoform X2 [Ascaphus truei]
MDNPTPRPSSQLIKITKCEDGTFEESKGAGNGVISKGDSLSMETNRENKVKVNGSENARASPLKNVPARESQEKVSSTDLNAEANNESSDLRDVRCIKDKQLPLCPPDMSAMTTENTDDPLYDTVNTIDPPLWQQEISSTATKPWEDKVCDNSVDILGESRRNGATATMKETNVVYPLYAKISKISKQQKQSSDKSSIGGAPSQGANEEVTGTPNPTSVHMESPSQNQDRKRHSNSSEKVLTLIQRAKERDQQSNYYKKSSPEVFGNAEHEEPPPLPEKHFDINYEFPETEHNTKLASSIH